MRVNVGALLAVGSERGQRGIPGPDDPVPAVKAGRAGSGPSGAPQPRRVGRLLVLPQGPGRLSLTRSAFSGPKATPSAPEFTVCLASYQERRRGWSSVQS